MQRPRLTRLFHRTVVTLLTTILLLSGPVALPARAQEIPGFARGSLIKAEDSAAVYRVMEDGLTLRHIVDWATFLAWGFDPGAIVTVPAETLDAYSIRQPLTRWITSTSAQGMYFVRRGRRTPIDDAAMLALTGGSLTDVYPIADDLLNSLPLADQPLEVPHSIAPPRPAVTAATWFDGALWAADASGGLTRWDGTQWQAVNLPYPLVITALLAEGTALYAGTDRGAVWELVPEVKRYLQHPDDSTITALAARHGGGLWIAGRSRYDLTARQYVRGGGLIATPPDRTPTSLSPGEAWFYLTTLAVDPTSGVVWAGTASDGLLRYDPALPPSTYTALALPASAFPDRSVTDLAFAPDGTLWIATPSGMAHYHDGVFDVVVADVPFSALAIAADGSIWMAGPNMIGRADGPRYDAFDHPLLLDDFAAVVLDGQDQPWFVGEQRVIHFDGTGWTAIDRTTGVITPFVPGDPPDNLTSTISAPEANYTAYLQSWPRPAQDNGRCMHYLQYPAGDVYEVREQIARLERLNVRWVLVNYTGQVQLAQMAPLFAEAQITALWRPFLRPYQRYAHWAEDVRFLRSLGLPPYLQVYNEPSLEVEWDGRPVDQTVFLQNLAEGVRAVYDAGGYPGLQTINPDWTRAIFQYFAAADLDDIFDRLWFAAHMYGGNHPPEYDADIYSVIGGMQAQAQVFQQEIGFVPPFIAGEGGWRPGEAGDTRYPPVSAELHRDYHVAVFEWFRTGVLSNGNPLPDYLFAFCPWLLSDPWDPAAWYDSASGDRTPTIQAVEALSPFERAFSWTLR